MNHDYHWKQPGEPLERHEAIAQSVINEYLARNPSHEFGFTAYNCWGDDPMNEENPHHVDPSYEIEQKRGQASISIHFCRYWWSMTPDRCDERIDELDLTWQDTQYDQPGMIELMLKNLALAKAYIDSLPDDY